MNFRWQGPCIQYGITSEGALRGAYTPGGSPRRRLGADPPTLIKERSNGLDHRTRSDDAARHGRVLRYDTSAAFDNAGGWTVYEAGITGGLTTGQDIVVRLGVKPTPTISKDQHTIDKVTRENRELKAVTRRDPTLLCVVQDVAGEEPRTVGRAQGVETINRDPGV